MINPKQARNFARAIAQRNKSDIIDARVLSEAIVIAREKEVQIPTIDPIAEEIKELMIYYRLKIKQRIQLSNHLESLVSKGGSKTLCHSIKAEIKHLKKSEEDIIEKIIVILNKSDYLKAKYDAITSVKGVG